MTAARPRPLLLPHALRRPAGIMAGAAAVVLAVLAARFAGTSSASGVDRHVDAVVDPVGAAHEWLVRHAMLFGSPPVVVLLAFAGAAVCLGLRRYRLALLAVAGPGITGLATTTLKPLIGRTIGDGFAFPSGHTGGATALGLVVALLLISLVRPRRAAGLAILAACALSAGGAVGLAMVAENAHYPTDVVGGFCTAVTIVLGLALLLDRVPDPRSATRSGPSGA